MATIPTTMIVAHRTIVPEECILTPQAIQAIAKSCDVGMYNPPGTNRTSWLGKMHDFCERYEIPVGQRAACARLHMGADCKEAAHAGGCDDMTWDEFTAWLHQYKRKSHVLILISAPANTFIR
jgi:hypothetical protein